MAALIWNAGNINDGDNFNFYNKKDSKMKQQKFQEETKALFTAVIKNYDLNLNFLPKLKWLFSNASHQIMI